MLQGVLFRINEMIPPERATLAQLAEHPICNRKVVDSISMGGSIMRYHLQNSPVVFRVIDAS